MLGPENLILIAKTLDSVLAILLEDQKNPAQALRDFAQELIDYKRQLTVHLARLSKDRLKLTESSEFVQGQQTVAQLAEFQAAQNPVEAFRLIDQRLAQVTRYYKLCAKIRGFTEQETYLQECLAKTNLRLTQVQHAVAELRSRVQEVQYALIASESRSRLDPHRYAELVREVTQEIDRISELGRLQRSLEPPLPEVPRLGTATTAMQRDLDDLMRYLKIE